jgi:hypothetical protein
VESSSHPEESSSHPEESRNHVAESRFFERFFWVLGGLNEGFCGF